MASRSPAKPVLASLLKCSGEHTLEPKELRRSHVGNADELQIRLDNANAANRTAQVFDELSTFALLD